MEGEGRGAGDGVNILFKFFFFFQKEDEQGCHREGGERERILSLAPRSVLRSAAAEKTQFCTHTIFLSVKKKTKLVESQLSFH